MARARLGKPLDAHGRERLHRLVADYERNPTLNERHFLRLREAMLAIQDEDAIARLNEALATTDFQSPAARLQQAYTFEELGFTEKAREAFDALRADLEQFKNHRTQSNVILAAARNAVNREAMVEAEELYQAAWERNVIRAEIRVEYAGILAQQGKFERANDILTSENLTLDDLYLQASLFAGMRRFDRAQRIYRTLAQEYPDDLRAQRGVANVEAWTHNYPLAIEKYQAIMARWPDDVETKVALTQTLAWNKDRRAAIKSGLALIPTLDGDHRRKVWLAILESIAELDEPTSDDQVTVMQAFGERRNFSHSAYFLERLADCLLFEFDADHAAPLVEQLVEMCPESNRLQTRYAQTLYKMGDFNRAAKHYQHLIETEALPDSLRERGDVLLAAAFNSTQRGDITEAAKRYNMAMECYLELIEQDQLETTYWLPFLNAVSGSAVHTKEVSLTVMEIFNARSSIADDRKLLLRLADALARIQEHRLAMQVLDDLARTQEDVQVQWRRANVLLSLAQHEAADAIFESLIRNDAFAQHDEQWIQLQLAAANNARQLGRDSRATDRYQQALDRLHNRLTKRLTQTPLWIPYLTALAGVQTIDDTDLSIVQGIYAERARMAENFDFLDRLKDVLLFAKQWPDTLPLFELLLNQRPGSRRLQLQYANALHACGQYAQAEPFFDDLSQRQDDVDPQEDVEDYDVYLSAANNALAQGKRRTAMFLYRQTLEKLEPIITRNQSATEYWPPFLSALSGLNQIPAKHSEAVLEIYRNRDLHDHDPDFLANLGHVLVLMERYSPAIDLLQQASQRFPEDKKLRIELASGFSAAGDYKQANAYYRWVIEHTERLADPLAESRLLMQAAHNSRFLSSLDDFEEYSGRALEILSDQLSANMEMETLWQPFLDAAAGASQLSSRDAEIALALFKRWRQRSHDTVFLDRLVDVLVKSHDIRRAIILLEHQEKNSPKTRLRLAMLLKEVGEYEAAESRFRELLARDFFTDDLASQADLLLTSAANARQLKEPELSQTRYHEALQLLRHSGRVQTETPIAIRYLHAVNGNEQLNSEDTQLVLDIRRDWLTVKDTRFRSHLVDTLLKLDRPNEALPILTTLVDEAPHSVDHQLRLAKTLQSLDRHAEASQIYDRLIDGGTIPPQSPLYVDLYASAARNSLVQQDYSAARRRFEALFEQPVDRHDFEVEYALVLQKTGDQALAIQLLEDQPSLTAEHRFLLAAIYAEAQDYERLGWCTNKSLPTSRATHEAYVIWRTWRSGARTIRRRRISIVSC